MEIFQIQKRLRKPNDWNDETFEYIDTPFVLVQLKPDEQLSYLDNVIEPIFKKMKISKEDLLKLINEDGK